MKTILFIVAAVTAAIQIVNFLLRVCLQGIL